jgi:pimeloyl-ACP methyl ester carboxylesterase
LLRAAKIDPPYLLVGQSFSGFNVRVFTKAYPSEVAGVVLLDSVQEDQQQYEPRSTLSPINRLPAIVRSGLCRSTPLAAKVGLIRLAMSASGPDRRVPSGFTLSEAIVLHRLESQPKAIVVSAGCGAWEKSAAEAREAGSLGDVRLIVLTAGKPLATGDPTEDRELRAFQEIWVHELQPKLAALSTRGRQIVGEESSHGGRHAERWNRGGEADHFGNAWTIAHDQRRSVYRPASDSGFAGSARRAFPGTVRPYQ